MFVGSLAPSIPMLPPHYPTDLKQGLRSIQAIPLTMRIGYSYLDNDSVDSSFTLRRPTHKLDATLSWLATDKLQLTALIGYVGRRQGVASEMESYVPIQLSIVIKQMISSHYLRVLKIYSMKNMNSPMDTIRPDGGSMVGCGSILKKLSLRF